MASVSDGSQLAGNVQDRLGTMANEKNYENYAPRKSYV